MLHREITRGIIDASITVLNQLKPGLDEKIYERALTLELNSLGLCTEQQREFPVYYRGSLVGKLVHDLIVARSVIADAKVVTSFTDAHVAQMLGYLNITGLTVALLINFKNTKLEWKRIVNDYARRSPENQPSGPHSYA